MNLRGFRYRLAPKGDEEILFRQFAGVCSLIYNLALEQRRDFHRQFQAKTGTILGYVAQAFELTALRNEFDWIARVYVSCQQQALRDLDRAYRNFFAGRAGYPTPRRKGLHKSFRFPGREIETKRLNARWSAVRLPKIGWVKYRDTRPLQGLVTNATVSCDALGWHISFTCEIEAPSPQPSLLPPVGIDRGVASMAVLSTGEAFRMPVTLEAIERRRRRLQRAVARKRRGSTRRLKTLRRVAQLSAKAARIRHDVHHKAALVIAGRFGTVVIEALRITHMTASARGTIEAPGSRVRQKAGLNRAILDQGWAAFERILTYKVEERGGTIVSVGPAYTSQTCSACGARDRESRENQARFSCRNCGFAIHADENAAINILRRNTALMRMEDGRQPTCEVRTQDELSLVGRSSGLSRREDVNSKQLMGNPGVLRTATGERSSGMATSKNKTSTSSRGFASMDRAKQREIARKGGESVPSEKRSFSQDRELASMAGRKGGEASHGAREKTR
jgi:putative transposase